MPAAVFHTLIEPEIGIKQSITPTILYFTLNSADDADYFFTQKEIVSGPQTTLEVLLKADVSTVNGASASIHGYCCTDTNPNVVHVFEVSDTKTGMKATIGKGYADQFKGFADSVDHVKFNIVLVERQMVLIGIIVLVKFPGGMKKQFLCDPQVGNGPPAIYKASLLF